MTEKQVLQWIKANLRPAILPAIAGTIYTEDWLGAMAAREVGILIVKLAPIHSPAEIWPLLKGDYSQRKNETHPQYHGFGPWQADINTAPEWIAANKWVDPIQAADKAVEILEEKRKVLVPKMAGFPQLLERAITASYNCGGGAWEAIKNGQDVDTHTTGHNYSADVWRLRTIYKTL
jgi:hypothetical protein